MHLLAALPARLASFATQVAPSGSGGAAPPANLVSGLNTLIGWAKYVGYGATIIGVIGAAVAMAVAHHRGTIGEHAGKLITAIAAAVVIGAAIDVVAVLAR